jgi:hypothetical protein
MMVSIMLRIDRSLTHRWSGRCSAMQARSLTARSVHELLGGRRWRAYLADPYNLPMWARGLVRTIERRGDHWFAQMTLGQATFRFDPPNDLGVFDHDVELPSGCENDPMRAIPNGSGCEILFTVLQVPGVSDEQVSADLETVRSDLLMLRKELELRYGSAAQQLHAASRDTWIARARLSRSWLGQLVCATGTARRR